MPNRRSNSERMMPLHSLERAGLTDFHFYDFRHIISDRVRRLTDAFTVHSDVKTTDIYVTRSFEEMRRAVDARTDASNVRGSQTA